MWVLTFPITERSTIDLNGNLVTAHPDQYAWCVCVCALLCMTVRGCTWLQVVFGCPSWTLVLPLGLYSGCQVNMQSPHSSLHLRVKRSRPHIQPHKKCFLYFFGTRFPFHISILLGVAEINLSQFGVSLLFPPVLCAKSSEKEAAPRDSCCGFVTTEQSSFLLGLQWSFCASDLPFSNPPGFFMCPPLQLLPCDL